jgi:ketosteroid isomerase-like protein
MSHENVQLHRRFLEAFNAGDLEAMIACSDPDIEFHSVIAAVGGGVYHRHEGLRRYYQDLEDVWGEETRVEPEAYFDLGESVLVFHLMHGRGRHSGLEIALAAAQVAKWRGGLLVYFKGYVRREDALSDLGVSVDELEPIAL